MDENIMAKYKLIYISFCCIDYKHSNKVWSQVWDLFIRNFYSDNCTLAWQLSDFVLRSIREIDKKVEYIDILNLWPMRMHTQCIKFRTVIYDFSILLYGPIDLIHTSFHTKKKKQINENLEIRTEFLFSVAAHRFWFHGDFLSQ